MFRARKGYDRLTEDEPQPRPQPRRSSINTAGTIPFIGHTLDTLINEQIPSFVKLYHLSYVYVKKTYGRRLYPFVLFDYNTGDILLTLNFNYDDISILENNIILFKSAVKNKIGTLKNDYEKMRFIISVTSQMKNYDDHYHKRLKIREGKDAYERQITEKQIGRQIHKDFIGDLDSRFNQLLPGESVMRVIKDPILFGKSRKKRR